MTEIDVFEIGGKAKGFERKYNMTMHVMGNAEREETLERGRRCGLRRGDWPASTTSTAWSGAKTRSKYFVDGVVVRSLENTHWHQPLFLTFDSETMPEWFGMPKDEDLPSTFSVEYVRAWKRK